MGRILAWMARPARPLIADGVYHIANRGNELRDIVRDNEDREVWLDYVRRTIRRYELRCLSYCLMDNHHHLLVQTPLANLSRAMQYLHGQYARAFRQRPGTPSGRLWQHRFRSRVIRGPEHFLVALRYIARNRVDAGLVESAIDWRWSAHAAITGEVDDPMVDRAHVLRWFNDDPASYAGFVDGDLQELPTFSAAQEALFPVEPAGTRLDRPPLADILVWTPGDQAISIAFSQYGYSMREIARELCCGRATVSRRLIAFETAAMFA
jgi:REP element-mobilizing transposase RayT